jgi:hypothetical protein
VDELASMEMAGRVVVSDADTFRDCTEEHIIAAYGRLRLSYAESERLLR